MRTLDRPATYLLRHSSKTSCLLVCSCACRCACCLPWSPLLLHHVVQAWRACMNACVVCRWLAGEGLRAASEFRSAGTGAPAIVIASRLDCL